MSEIPKLIDSRLAEVPNDTTAPFSAGFFGTFQLDIVGATMTGRDETADRPVNERNARPGASLKSLAKLGPYLGSTGHPF